MVRNFNRFEVGRYYIYTGNVKHDTWNLKMAVVLDHKPVKCIEANIFESHANFDRIMLNNHLWEWRDGFDYWIEIREPGKEWNILPGERYYDGADNDVCTYTYSERKSLKCFDNFMYALIDSKCKEDTQTKSITHNFKIGDRVKIVRKNERDDLEWDDYKNSLIGKFETITDLSVRASNRYRLSHNFWFNEESLEPAPSYFCKFKVGDTVKIVKKFKDNSELNWLDSDMNFCIGKTGKITKIDNNNSEPWYKVETEDTNWFYLEESLEAVRVNDTFKFKLKYVELPYSGETKLCIKSKKTFTIPKIDNVKIKIKKRIKKFTI